MTTQTQLKRVHRLASAACARTAGSMFVRNSRLYTHTVYLLPFGSRIRLRVATAAWTIWRCGLVEALQNEPAGLD